MSLFKLLLGIVEQLSETFTQFMVSLRLGRLSKPAVERIVLIIVLGCLFMLFWLIQGITWIWLIQFLLRPNS